MEKTKKNKHKSITRFDYESTNQHGYYVRVALDGKVHKPRFFSDKKFGTMQRALANAIIYRDMIEKKVGKFRTNKIVVTKSHNSTGLVGIRKIMRKQRKKGILYSWPCFEVSGPIVDGERARITVISIKKHGEEKALEMAKEKRDLFTREMYQKEKNN